MNMYTYSYKYKIDFKFSFSIFQDVPGLSQSIVTGVWSNQETHRNLVITKIEHNPNNQQSAVYVCMSVKYLGFEIIYLFSLRILMEITRRILRFFHLKRSTK